jgi:exodeoxyribonuclease V alpha subunit
MTVHKSQGSEFDEILLILPDRFSPLLNRELIYTALTRARQKIHIWGNPEILCDAVRSRVERRSGLSSQLEAMMSQANN